MVALGHWVLLEACRQAVLWNGAVPQPVTMFVNVSAAELARADFVATVQETLAVVGLPADRLCLELREGTLLAGDRAREVCSALAGLGIQLAIDGYGSGFSSLAALKQFRVNWLKIDQQFVRALGPSGGGGAIVDASVRLAGSLSLGSVGQGVECEQQVVHLRSMGCERAQGFYFGAPQRAEVVGTQLAAGHWTGYNVGNRVI